MHLFMSMFRLFGDGVVHFSCVGSAPAHFLIYTKYEKRRMQMEDYKKLYYELFNKITDIIEELEKIQQDTEERYISAEADK